MEQGEIRPGCAKRNTKLRSTRSPGGNRRESIADCDRIKRAGAFCVCCSTSIFPGVNDQFGHLCGDEVLKAAWPRLSGRCARTTRVPWEAMNCSAVELRLSGRRARRVRLRQWVNGRYRATVEGREQGRAADSGRGCTRGETQSNSRRRDANVPSKSGYVNERKEFRACRLKKAPRNRAWTRIGKRWARICGLPTPGGLLARSKVSRPCASRNRARGRNALRIRATLPISASQRGSGP